jgi:hypothetical protein
MSGYIDARIAPQINPGAGKPAPATSLVNVLRLLAAHADERLRIVDNPNTPVPEKNEV